VIHHAPDRPALPPPTAAATPTAVHELLDELAATLRGTPVEQSAPLHASALAAAALISAHACQAQRAAVAGTATLSAITRLDAVVNALDTRIAATNDRGDASALGGVRDLLVAQYTGGDNYHVTLTDRTAQRHEVVVRATDPQVAVTRIRTPLYVIGDLPPATDCTVHSIARLSLHGPCIQR
jgi:hypothetical protein